MSAGFELLPQFEAARVQRGCIMLRCRTLFLAGWLGLLAAVPAFAAGDLTARIGAVIHGPDYKHAHWGILVVDAADGRTLYAHNPDKLFAPASVTKLYSCAAALALLGPDHRFETPVYRRGEVKEGTLQGDLILVASGDLTFGGRTDASGRVLFTNEDHTYANSSTSKASLTDSDPLAGLKALAQQIAGAGIRRVQGEVLIDARLFDRAQGTGSGPGIVTPILVNDNVIDVLVKPGDREGVPALLTVRPESSYYQMDAQFTTVAAGRPTRIDILGVAPRRFLIRGEIALGFRPILRVFPVDDPPAFARALFIEALRREGVAIDASPLQDPRSALPPRDGYDKLTRVAVFTSPPLSEAIKVVLKVSHNLYASTLPLLIAAKHGERTLAEGLHRQRRFLAEVGVDVGTISFGGGAGGAASDCTTPRATVQLLQGMAKRSEYSVYRDCLPILGVDGTLYEAVSAESPARAHVYAKTGTLSYEDVMNERGLLRSKALAGVMTTAKGRQVLIALFVNNVPLPAKETPSREGKVLAKICEIVYQHAP